MTAPSTQPTLMITNRTAPTDNQDANRAMAQRKIKRHFAGILDALVEKALDGNVPAIKLALDLIIGREKNAAGEGEQPSGIEEFHSKHKLKV